MLNPFGTTIENLSKLKQMGSIPMKLVQQTLNAMSAIADFYQNLYMNSSKGTLNASILSAIMTSFGKTTESMKGIKGLKSVPTEAVESITASASNIIMFYNTAYFEDIDSIDEKSRLTELVVNKFINVAMNIQDNFANIKRIDFNSLYYIVSACRSIINYYRKH